MASSRTSAQAGTSRPGRLPPEARHRHRNPHARHQLRTSGPRPGDRLAGRVLPHRRACRWGLQHRPADGQRRSRRGPRSTRLSPALHRRIWTAVRRCQRERPLTNLGFKGIRSLEPGTLAVANRHGLRIERFAIRRAWHTASSNGSTSRTSPARSTIARSDRAASLGTDFVRGW